MSAQNPYQQLGVTESSSFEEIQAARQRLIQQYSDDSQVVESIESAYDAIIMDRLRMRQEGKIKVPERIRYPEREAPPESTFQLPSLPVKAPPSWLQDFLDTPSKNDIFISAGVFLSLMAIAVFAPGVQSSAVPLLLTLGIFASVYFLNRKEKRFWRSVLITLAAFFIGMGLGYVLAKLMGASLVLDSQQLYALVTFCLLWLCSSFLK